MALQPSATKVLEDELLCCCAQVRPATAARERLAELIVGPLDWKAVVNRSWWHRIRPLTFRHLRSQPAGTVPESVLAELAEYVHELGDRNRRLSRELRTVSEYFEQAGLPALVFRGPTLSEDAYGDLSLRECGDLDLLVRRDDFVQAAKMLTSHGFESSWERGDRRRQVFAREFQRGDTALDVHWELSPEWLNYRIDFKRMWEAATPLSSENGMLRKLCPEDALMVLCIHGTKHWWERLRWINDIAELVNRELVTQWDRLESASIQARCWRSVLLGLYLAGDLLSARLPEELTGRIEATPGIARLGRQVRVWLGHAENSPEMRKLSERFVFRMGVCERKRDRMSQIARYLAGRAFHPS
jgi:hypothetical protein